MDIFFLTLLLLVINKLIVDTQTQISGILFFKDQEQDLIIWIRPQPQFVLNEIVFTSKIPFVIINNRDGQDVLEFAYQVADHEVILFYEIQQQKFVLDQFLFNGPLNVPWVLFQIHKSTEKIEFIQHYDRVFSLQNMKLHQPYMIYSWQSTLFSSCIYDQYEFFSLNFLILQNDVFIKQQEFKNFNFRFLTILMIYFKFQKTLKDVPFIQIQDQSFSIQILLNLTNIRIDFDYGYYKSLSQAFNSNMTNQWIQISLFNEYEKILCQIAFQGIFLEQYIHYNEPYDMSIFSKTIAVDQYLQNYKIFIINKFINTQQVSLDKFCFQNCKICDKLQCLECEGQLSLEANCLCPVNQEFHPSLGFCIDKTLTQNIYINSQFNITFCPFGQYYDQEYLKCTECPKLNEFNFSTCLYNLQQWYYTIIIYFTTTNLQIISPKENLYPKRYFLQLNDQIQRLNSRDIYRILLELCEQNYYFKRELQKCMILSKGSHYGFYLNTGKMVACKIGYAYLKNCIKCQRNCLFCTFINRKLICILPTKSYTLNQNQQIIRCQDNRCQEIENLKFDECEIENCLVCYFSACLVCDHKYVQDYNDFCHFGSKYSAYLQFEINENLIKPQYDHQQILYIRYQLERLKIDLQTFEIFQLIMFANNLKAMRQDQLPQSQNKLYYKDNQQVYCLNQTQFFQQKFCHEPVPGYQYVQSLDKYVYCYNQNCQFDLIYQVTVQFTNKPSIKYQNMTFVNFQHFAQSLSLDELLINNIIIEAIVYVFDTFQNDCEGSFFTISDRKIYNYQVILDFQGVSVFPNCSNVLRIEFNEVSLINLFTYSQLQMEFTCSKLLIKNCTFLKQENLQLNIEASYVQLEQIFIQGILKEQVQHIIDIYNPKLIENLLINNLYIGDFNLINSNLINLQSKVNQIQFSFIKLQNNKLKRQSTFLSNHDAINLKIEFLIIDNMIFDQSGLVILTFFPSTLLTIDNFFLQKSHVEQSVLIRSISLNLYNISFIDVQLVNSNLIKADQSLTIQNIIFQKINFLHTQIVNDFVKQIQLIQFLIIDSLIITNSQSLIKIETNSFSFRFIYLKNCDYSSNLQLIYIKGRQGIIENFIITNTSLFKEIMVQDNQNQDMITIYADKIILQWVSLVDLIFNIIN